MTDSHARSTTTSKAWLVVGWSALIAFVLGAAWVGDIYTPARRVFGVTAYPIVVWQVLYVVGFVGYVILLRTFSRRSPGTWIIILAAIGLRLPLLFCPPNSDCNRYIWEGWIQNEGYSPYTLAPNQAPPELCDKIHAGINHPHYPTIYPPLSQLAFRAMASVCYSVKTPQVVHTILDVCVVLMIATLLRKLGRPDWHLAVYALCPMVLASFAHAGHNDPLILLAILGFIYLAMDKRWALAGGSLGLAVLAKTTPAILLALLPRRSWKAIGVALATIAAGYLLYFRAGEGLFDVLKKFPNDGPFNNPFDAIRGLWNDLGAPRMFISTRNHIALVVLALAAIRFAWRPRDLVNDARWLLVITVLLLPIIHFWYLTWPFVLVTLQFRGRWAWVALTGTMALYWYADFAGLAGMRWDLPKWAVGAIWAPFFAVWFYEWRKCAKSCAD
ncbi:MAG TPA: glycosyltransferase family 87 protein [Phycisphaerae bacterium]|nr:glycosyltransferase family 87 protein [Phycisphaerae bacterium]HRW52608.1 glycosyltransferase family 87 protein [Phycisphaerae bacterium]